MIQHVIARYGEISLKGKNRANFERMLVKNMQRVVRDFPSVKVSRVSGSILVTLNGTDADTVIGRLKAVFGIISLIPVEVADLAMESMIHASLALLGQSTVKVRTFKFEVKRPNKRFPMKSPEIAARLGADLLSAMPELTVDVHHPDITIFVEIRDHEAFVYGTKTEGLGGLPVGASGKVGLLLSGGIDSPVAGWLALKRGVELEAIHFHSFPFTSERSLQKVETLAQVLANWAGQVRLHVVHFTDVQTAIKKHCPEELGITIMRRMMLRIASRIAEDRKLLALATGESLGQVASQTLESMRVINAVTNLPILRPLISEDKVDIIRRARSIGTYETSILPFEDCCTLFVPKTPRTKPRMDEVETAEVDLEVDKLVSEALARTTMKTFLAESFV